MWSGGSFPEMYERVTRFLTRSSGLGRGRGLMLAANILFADDVRNLPRALALTEEALPLLAEDPVSAAKTLINGLVYTRLASESAVADAYARRLMVIDSVHSKAVADWRGRITVGLGQHFEEGAQFPEALARFKQGVTFHQANVGPHRNADYGERDQRCYLAMSLAGCARMCVQFGRLDQAEAYNRQVLSARLPGEYNPHYGYLSALIALNQGHLHDVEQPLMAILHDPRAKKDHEMRQRCAELLARYYAAVGDFDQAHQILYPIMQEAGSVRSLLRTQRYLKGLRSKSA